MARLYRRYDLLLCPTVPGMPPLADVPTEDAMTALWREWAPWTFAFNLSRQPAISVPMGLGSTGISRSVQLAGALYRDDLVLRAARVIETAWPVTVPDLSRA
jgi:aspartyl-tRNA(Asn)/glutamyl-tRNA(Gln) amidotransferase subunit A